jgi:RNA ligase
VHLYDLTPAFQLGWLTSNGYVREVEHPTEPLNLLNYTDRAMTKPELFQHQPALNHTRGLIYNRDTGAIVARPFRKFWNYGQPQAPQIPLDASVIVTDKVDGSLGILYRRPSDGRYAIATRGSFTSPQALHGTEVLQERYPNFVPMDDDTLLFEIVYPENRIVLDYGTEDNLFLLGAVEKQRGFVVAPEIAARYHGWEGPRAHTFAYRTLAEALAAPPRVGAEGMVVRHPRLDGDDMVKIKQEDYLVLHRVVFGLSTRRVYEAILAGETLEQILEPLPDEFHEWTRAVYTELYAAFNKRFKDLTEAYRNAMSYAREAGIADRDEDGWYVDRTRRGALARLFQESDDAWALFAQLDDHDITDRIWKDLRPAAGQTPSNYEPKKIAPTS